ncbi:reverse transcriptase domain-containing protein [Tanacetum coccineum]|uniref:Reverse transcriptase domain-containing protein n=1 Tax=Tanacetum coccineum TaxID=301880 RepID=A0ABQ5AW25_9ASTR
MAPKRTTRSTRVPPVTPAPTTTTVTEAQLQALIDQGVAAAMAEAEASRVRNGYNSNGSGPRPAQTARECSYSEFLKCKPLDFKGTEGVVGLTRWFEKMESVFSISNCPAASQVKFATCTLQDDALTWWNAHVKTTTTEAAHAMPWAALKKMMTDKYCPRGEIKKIETEMWNLKNVWYLNVAYSMTWVYLRKKMTDKYCPRNEMKKLEAELWNLKVIEVIEKGFPIFLAHVTTKEAEDKSKKKRLHGHLIDWRFRMNELSEQLKEAIRQRSFIDQFPHLGEDSVLCQRKDGSSGCALIIGELY